ncbi:P-loop NTPase fold protein [Kangiella sp. TOML190]|uniref:P-loop NTPase fold protein n=1 Tax=Kangiella sp. TOML190 TaxID=2931351 RepID=UPI00203CEDD9|nr:P-loop NTPase fold protein [Kangiella sp. TOML190]
MAENTFNFEMLYEQVSEKDLFEDQTHQKTADTLHTLIEQSEKACTIGLSGDWGAGKSTVIELLRKKFPDDSTLFFLFDAWAHEGDPLRRIFLESLINHIDPDNKDETLQENKQKISSKFKKVTVKSKKRASKLGAILTISGLFVPIGIGLTRLVKDNEVVSPFHNSAGDLHILYTISLLLIAAPLLALIGWAIFGEKRKNKKKFLKIFPRKDWSFFKVTSKDKYNQEIFEDGEKTSIEFEQYFKEILSNYIGRGKRYNRAIIVVDNLDRVEHADFLKIWSTLQSFFQNRNLPNKGNDYINNTWFIIPFDERGLEQIWSKKDSARQEYQETVNNSENGNLFYELSKSKNTVARSFINKSFQVLLEVPKPIMSGWKRYLSEHAFKSLSSWSEEDVKDIVEHYESYISQEKRTPPTPRKIRNYINQLGVLKLRYGSEFESIYLSIYATLRNDLSREELQEKLIGKSLPAYIYSEDEELLYQKISAILFAVNLEKGVELLIAPKISDAYYSGKIEVIGELLSSHPSAFWIAYKSVKRDLLPSVQTSEDGKLNYLSILDEPFKNHLPNLAQERRAIQSAIIGSKDFNYKKFDYADEFLKLLRVTLDRESLIDWLELNFKDGIKKCLSDFDKTDRGAHLEYLSDIETVINAENKEKPSRLYYTNLNVEKVADWYNLEKSLGIEFSFVLPNKSLLKDATSSITTSNYLNSELSIACMKVLSRYPRYFEQGRDELIESLNNWALSPQSTPENKIGYSLLFQLFIIGTDEQKSVIETAVRNSNFISYLTSYVPQPTPEIIMLLALTLKDELLANSYVNDAYKSQFNQELDEEFVELLYGVISEYSLFEDLWELSLYKFAFSGQLIMRAHNEGVLKNYVPAVLTYNQIDWLKKGFPKNEITLKLFDAFLSTHDISEVTEHLKSSPLEKDNDKVLYLLSVTNFDLVREVVVDILAIFTKEQWDSCFENNFYYLDIAIENDLKGSSNYTESFEDFFNITIKENKETEEWFFDYFEQLLNVVASPETSMSNITLKYFSHLEDLLRDEYFNIFKDHFSSYVNRVSTEHLDTRIYAWLKGEKWERISWIVNEARLKSFKANDNLQVKIKDLQAITEDEKQSAILKSLAKRLRVK